MSYCVICPKPTRCKECQSKHWAKYIADPENRRRHRLRNADRAREHRAALRAFVRKQKAKPCLDCNQEHPYYVMDFDHRDGDLKEDKISTMVAQGVTKQKILDEIAKCDLVCANCHRKRTFRRGKLQLKAAPKFLGSN